MSYGLDPYAAPIVGAADTIMQGVAGLQQQKRQQKEDAWTAKQRQWKEQENELMQKKREYVQEFMSEIQRNPEFLNQTNWSQYGEDAFAAMSGAALAAKQLKANTDMQLSIDKNRLAQGKMEFGRLHGMFRATQDALAKGDAHTAQQSALAMLNDSNNFYTAKLNQDGTFNVYFDEPGDPKPAQSVGQGMPIEQVLQEASRFMNRNYPMVYAETARIASESNDKAWQNPQYFKKKMSDGSTKTVMAVKQVHPFDVNRSEMFIFNEDGSTAGRMSVKQFRQQGWMPEDIAYQTNKVNLETAKLKQQEARKALNAPDLATLKKKADAARDHFKESVKLLTGMGLDGDIVTLFNTMVGKIRKGQRPSAQESESAIATLQRLMDNPDASVSFQAEMALRSLGNYNYYVRQMTSDRSTRPVPDLPFRLGPPDVLTPEQEAVYLGQTPFWSGESPSNLTGVALNPQQEKVKLERDPLFSGYRYQPQGQGLQSAQAGEQSFDPEGKGYDYATARAADMGPVSEGKNKGHWGSVTRASAADREKYGLPENSYILLKGRNHPTWDLAVKAEQERGSKIVQLGERYYSVPEGWTSSKEQASVATPRYTYVAGEYPALFSIPPAKQGQSSNQGLSPIDAPYHWVSPSAR